MAVSAFLRVLACAATCLLAAAASQAADGDDKSAGAQPATRFFDPTDGWFDVSDFLDTAYGFIPIVAPITEPAVGYGAAGALVFIDRDAPGKGQRFARPNIAVAGGLATENGTRGLFGGHLGNWLDGRLRTLVGLADVDANLEFFGLGGERRPGGSGLGYTVAARGGVVGASYRLEDTELWVGLRYALATTRVSLTALDGGLPEIPSSDRDLRLAGLTPSLTLDTRDNFFPPTRGSYVDLSVPVFREALGGNRNFEKAALTAMHFEPLSRTLFFSVRGTAQTSSDGTPFYLRPFVWLRGVQALQYQGDQAAEVEAELRWQFHPRFSLVGFGGTGIARGSSSQPDREKAVVSGGGGVRYLVAREYGLWMGLDVGFGPDKPIIYVVFGYAWIRP